MGDLVVQMVDDPGDILRARRLHGARYLDAGFVATLDAGGVIDDEFVELSDYFAAFDESGAIVGTFRLIPAAKAQLPILTDFELDAEAAELFAFLEPWALAEMSALAVARSSRARGGEVARELYRAVFHHSLVVAGYSHVAAVMDVRVARHIARLHGSHFTPVGPSRHYMGSPTVPMVLDLHRQLRHYVATPSADSDFFLDGLVIDLRDNRFDVALGLAERRRIG